MEIGKKCWWILLASTLTQMCAALSTQGIGVLSGFLQQDFGLSNSQVGILAGVLNTAPILGLILVGKILDHTGERIPVFIGMMIISASMMLMSLVHYYWLLVLMLFISGIGYSPIQPGGSRAIYSWFPAGIRGIAMGIRQAALPLGGAIAAIFFPFLISYSNWRAAVSASSLLILLAAFLFFVIYRNAPDFSLQKNTHKVRVRYREIFSHPTFFRISRVGIILVAIQTVVLTFWMLFLHQRFHISLFAGARYLFAIQISGTVGRVVISALSDRIREGRRRIVSMVMFVIAILLSVIAYLPQYTSSQVLMIMSCFLGFFCFGWYGPWVIWLSEESHEEKIGSMLSLSMAFNQLSIALAPILFGILIDVFINYKIPWFILAALLILIGCLEYLAHARSRFKGKQSIVEADLR